MRGRIASTVIVAAAILVGTAGCNLMAPQATENKYFPSDGVNADLGEVDVLNAVIITNDGEVGNLVFTAVNDSADERELTVQFETGGEKQTETIDLEPGSVTEFGSGSNTITIDGLDTRAGALFPVHVATDDAASDLLVPVLNGDLPEYSTLTPKD